jgi:hypothetical protein
MADAGDTFRVRTDADKIWDSITVTKLIPHITKREEQSLLRQTEVTIDSDVLNNALKQNSPV